MDYSHLMSTTTTGATAVVGVARDVPQYIGGAVDPGYHLPALHRDYVGLGFEITGAALLVAASRFWL